MVLEVRRSVDSSKKRLLTDRERFSEKSGESIGFGGWSSSGFQERIASLREVGVKTKSSPRGYARAWAGAFLVVGEYSGKTRVKQARRYWISAGSKNFSHGIVRDFFFSCIWFQGVSRQMVIFHILRNTGVRRDANAAASKHERKWFWANTLPGRLLSFQPYGIQEATYIKTEGLYAANYDIFICQLTHEENRLASCHSRLRVEYCYQVETEELSTSVAPVVFQFGSVSQNLY